MIGQSTPETPTQEVVPATPAGSQQPAAPDLPTKEAPKEWGGREGPEPTRYGDWEKNGRCIDF